jgi:hypothetical protein
LLGTRSYAGFWRTRRPPEASRSRCSSGERRGSGSSGSRSGSPPCCASELQHPDIHWYFPLERPKRVAANKLREKLEEARLTELDARRADPLRRLAEDAPTGLHLGTIENLRQRALRRPAMGPRTVFIVGRAE